MKKLLLTFMTVFLLLCSCTNKADEPVLSDELIDAKIAWMKLDDVDKSKVLFMGSDKSYMIFDGDAGNGRMTLYYNSSVENDIDDGIMVYMDSEGKPELIRISGDFFLINNLNESTFDMAHRKKVGGYEYHWDVPFVSWPESRSHSFFYYMWPGVTDFDWSWDEHIKAALGPFALKMLSFTVDAFSVVLAPTPSSVVGLFMTLAGEMRKSGYQFGILDEMFLSGLTPIDMLNKLGLDADAYFQGELKFSPRGFGLSVISSTLNRMGDEGLQKMGQMKKVTEPIFADREWQIKLNPGALTFEPKASQMTVRVDTKALWVIDQYSLEKWCSAKKEGDHIVVSVKENESRESRWCSLKVKTQTYSPDIPPAVLYITQHGIVFEVSPTSLSFTADGGSKGVFVTMSENIKSWEITSAPRWVKIEKGRESFFVDVAKSEESRSSVITVTGYAGDGIKIDRNVQVEQIVGLSWEGTSWNFSGTMNCTIMGESISQPCDFGIIIADIAKNKFTLTGFLKGYEHLFKLKLNENGTLDLIYSEKQSYQGTSVTANASFLMSRIDMDNAGVNLSGEIFVTDSEFGRIKAGISGKLSGKRIPDAR